MLEPRRLATRAVATRMAATLGESVGRNRRLPHAPRNARQPPHAHRGRDRGRVHAHVAERSGARRRRRRVVRRVPRAQPARRHRARVRARFAGEPRARAAPAGDVGHARRRGGRQVVRRCAAWSRAAGRVFPVEIRYAGTRHAAAARRPRRRRELAVLRAIKRALAEVRGRHAGVPARAPARSAACRACSRTSGDVDVLPLYGELGRRRTGRGAATRASRDAARSCSPPTSPRPASPSTACASSSTRDSSGAACSIRRAA